jgi:hypothetical protein
MFFCRFLLFSKIFYAFAGGTNLNCKNIENYGFGGIFRGVSDHLLMLMFSVIFNNATRQIWKVCNRFAKKEIIR